MKIKDFKCIKYFQVKTELIKSSLSRIKNRIKNRIKQKLNDYFSLENSLGHLNKLFKDFFIISIGFDEIKNGMKNSKRFKLCILVCILM